MMGPQGRQRVKAMILVALLTSGIKDITPIYSINESTNGRDIYLGGISEVFLATNLSKNAVKKSLRTLTCSVRAIHIVSSLKPVYMITIRGFGWVLCLTEKTGLFPMRKRHLVGVLFLNCLLDVVLAYGLPCGIYTQQDSPDCGQ